MHELHGHAISASADHTGQTVGASIHAPSSHRRCAATDRYTTARTRTRLTLNSGGRVLLFAHVAQDERVFAQELPAIGRATNSRGGKARSGISQPEGRWS